MRHKASKIDFRRLAGEVEDSDSEVEAEQPSKAEKPIITSNKYRQGIEKRKEEIEEYPKDACVCCHQVNQWIYRMDSMDCLIRVHDRNDMFQERVFLKRVLDTGWPIR